MKTSQQADDITPAASILAKRSGGKGAESRNEINEGLDEMARKRKEATIIRAPKDNKHPYKSVRRATIEDPRLSWEERGLLSYLLVKPDDWEISVPALIKVGGAGKNKMYAMIAHLEELRYLEREEIRERGRFVGVRLLLHEIPLPEIGETVEPSPFPENREMATRVSPFPDLRDPVKPLPVKRTRTNKEYSTNKEQSTNKEEMNERMNESAPGEDSFIHWPDQQIEIDDCIDLLTDPEVGLDEKKARELAAKYDFDALERHVFAWLAHRDKGGDYGTTGALLTRIRRNFSAPVLTAEQRRSELYQRFHTAGYSGVKRRHRDYEVTP